MSSAGTEAFFNIELKHFNWATFLSSSYSKHVFYFHLEDFRMAYYCTNVLQKGFLLSSKKTLNLNSNILRVLSKFTGLTKHANRQ